MTQLCHCGQPLHYSDPKIQAQVEEIIAMTGEFIEVKLSGKTWRVQRHYIALHGLKGSEVASLGFEQVS